jgi:hypothetical protein
MARPLTTKPARETGAQEARIRVEPDYSELVAVRPLDHMVKQDTAADTGIIWPVAGSIGRWRST